MGNRNDLFAADVTAAASSVLKDDEKVKTLCQRAKNQMRVKLDITDAEFEEAVKGGRRAKDLLMELSRCDAEAVLSAEPTSKKKSTRSASRAGRSSRR
jgi:hypothetical protein